MGLIRDWAPSLEIAKGAMQGQLGRVTSNDLAQNSDDFFAIKALCFLISDLETEPWRIHSFGQGGVQSGGRNSDRADSRGWT